MSSENHDARGWVYVISNPGLNGLVKIGFTMKDPMMRAKELSSTGNPYPYKVEYEVFCENPYAIETRVHASMANVRADKEWFKSSVQHAVNTIRTILGSRAIYEKKVVFVPEYRALHDKGLGGSFRTPGDLKNLEFCRDKIVYPSQITVREDRRKGLETLSWCLDKDDPEKWLTSEIEQLLEIADTDITNEVLKISKDDYPPEPLIDLRVQLMRELYYHRYDRYHNELSNLISAGTRYKKYMYERTQYVMFEILILCRENKFSVGFQKLKRFRFELLRMPTELDGSIDREFVLDLMLEGFHDYPELLKILDRH